MTTTPTASDETITRAKAGDRDALAEIFRIYHPLLVRYLRTRAPAVSDDVASQTWVSVAESITGFEGDGDALRGWILTVGYRRLADEYRRRGRRLDEPTEVPDGVDNQTPEEIVTGTMGWAETLIRRLPPQQADVLTMRVIGDLSVDEVAKVMGLSPGNVRVLSHRALKRLHELVTGRSDLMEEFDEFGVTPGIAEAM